MSPSSEVYIEATGTDPAVRAQDELGRERRRLRARLAELTGAGDPSALAEFCAGELRGHLTATDRTLYAAASGAAETRLLVRALRAGLATLEERIDTLAACGGTAADEAGQAASAAADGRVVEALLAAQMTAEETVLVPALATLPGADLPQLTADLRTLAEGGRLENPDVVDVREIPHGQRHPRIFARYARLTPGEGFVLVNNHDPKPLRREFEATHSGAYTWDYVESGPEVWQVRIGRTAADA